MIQTNDILNAFPGPCAVINLSGEILASNDRLKEYGIREGTHCLDILKNDQLTLYYDILCEIAQKKAELNAEQYVYLFKEIPIADRLYIVYIGSRNNLIYIYAFNETRIRETTNKLFRDASIDPLTGLLNRRRFMKEAENRIFPKENVPFLIYFDIDHFKRVNDTYGHDAGDDVLCHVAKTAHGTLRVNDILARVGGEEFVLYGSAPNEHEILKIAERLRSCVEHSPAKARLKSDGPEQKHTEIQVTISVGIDIGRKEVTELISHADSALYVAKTTGRNRVVLYAPGMVKKEKA